MVAKIATIVSIERIAAMPMRSPAVKPCARKRSASVSVAVKSCA